jgi:hypothetical protein
MEDKEVPVWMMTEPPILIVQEVSDIIIKSGLLNSGYIEISLIIYKVGNTKVKI